MPGSSTTTNRRTGSSGVCAAAEDDRPGAYPLLGVRSGLGGALMGLANLVPGISGGTMLLASGVYPRFVEAVAEVCTLRFRRASLFVLAMVVACAGMAILLLAGPVKSLVVEHRWVMYSLFIGLTLGGVPIVWRMIRPATAAVWVGAGVGFAAMALLAWVQQSGAGTAGGEERSFPLMVLAGVAGASAMILPGVSGGYLLLVLGVYLPILAAIDALKQAVGAVDIGAATEPVMNVVLPVGIGVVVGVAVVSNGLRLLLARFEKATLGVLLGLLVGAVVGLWPFQRGVPPQVGDVVNGRVMTEQLIAALDPDKYPTAFFQPTMGHVLGAAVLIGVGFAATALIGRVGGENGGNEAEAEDPFIADEVAAEAEA